MRLGRRLHRRKRSNQHVRYTCFRDAPAAMLIGTMAPDIPECAHAAGDGDCMCMECHAGRAMSSNVMAGRSGAMRRTEGRGARQAKLLAGCCRYQRSCWSILRLRGISQRTLARNGVLQDAAGVIAFPYRRDGQVVNLKYRTLDKRFWQVGCTPVIGVPGGKGSSMPCTRCPAPTAIGCILAMRQVKGAEKVLYGLDDVKTAGEIIIVEGEMDKLALEEAGMTNVLSVPDGAPR